MKKFIAIMSPLSSSLTMLLALLVLIVSQELVLLNSPLVLASSDYTRKDFPPHFVFGSGTSAYQVEGAASEDGRTPSELDTRAHNGGFNGEVGDVACDEYHRYKEDVQLMADTGLEAYRFSISWSRLIPNGRGPVNPKAVEYYNNLINETLKHGIQPHATMLHLDLPQALEDDFGGWRHRDIVVYFTAYADICFKEFGDRVKHWTTINEPNCNAAYFTKTPYIGGHNMLLAHASVVKLYREKYKAKQQGFVGLSVSTNWFIPKSDTKEDSIAAERVHHFTSGWFIHPLVFGDYPATMKQALGEKLPSFSEHETKLVKGSFDFIGINSYGTYTVEDNPTKPYLQANCLFKDGKGKYILEYFKETFDNPPLYVHENGYPTNSNNASLRDSSRVEFLNACIRSVLDAARNGSNVKGYFYWSFLDLFELPQGYEIAYGLYFVDFKDPDLRRYPKLSAHWYSTFLKGGRSPSSMVMDDASWKLLEDKERQLWERNNKIKMLTDRAPGVDDSCRCTVDVGTPTLGVYKRFSN